jgi:uncharacterized protein
VKEELQKLCQLQEIDLDIDSREKALAALDNGDTTRAELAQLTSNLGVAAAQRKKVETEYHDRELELKTIEAKKKKAEDLMYSGKVHNLKELEDLQKETAMFVKEIDRLSTCALELMDELETARNAEKESKAAQDATQKGLDEILERFTRTGDRLREELADLQKQRSEFTPTVEAAMLKLYEQNKARRGVPVIGVVDDDLCGACHVAIPSHIMTALYAAKQLQYCDSCGRILALTCED